MDTPPAGVFTKVSAGDMHSCAIRDTGELACWGWNGQGMATPPVMGRFVDVSTGLNHSCAVREDDVILCFGADFDGQATPP
jgi:alpha-tubulin suppressor-like RCC1 family protein